MQILTTTFKALRLIVRHALLIFVLLPLTLSLLWAQMTPSPETKIKGVFLYNFAHFTEWPQDKFTHASSPLVIGILGEDPFGPFMDSIVTNEKIAGHPIEIHRYASLEDMGPCHLLFVERNHSKRLEEIVRKVKGGNILTVSDIDDFTPKGGIIKFYLEDNKMRFQVNMSAVNATDLILSSRLLRLASIFGEQNNK